MSRRQGGSGLGTGRVSKLLGRVGRHLTRICRRLKLPPSAVDHCHLERIETRQAGRTKLADVGQRRALNVLYLVDGKHRPNVERQEKGNRQLAPVFSRAPRDVGISRSALRSVLLIFPFFVV